MKSWILERVPAKYSDGVVLERFDLYPCLIQRRLRYESMNFDLWNEKSKFFSKWPLTPKHDLFFAIDLKWSQPMTFDLLSFFLYNLRRMTFDLWSYHTVIWFRRQTTVRDVQPCKELNTLIKIHLCAQVSIHFELSHFFDWYSMLFTRHMFILIWSFKRIHTKRPKDQ